MSHGHVKFTGNRAEIDALFAQLPAHLRPNPAEFVAGVPAHAHGTFKRGADVKVAWYKSGKLNIQGAQNGKFHEELCRLEDPHLEFDNSQNPSARASKAAVPSPIRIPARDGVMTRENIELLLNSLPNYQCLEAEDNDGGAESRFILRRGAVRLRCVLRWRTEQELMWAEVIGDNNSGAAAALARQQLYNAWSLAYPGLTEANWNPALARGYVNLHAPRGDEESSGDEVEADEEEDEPAEDEQSHANASGAFAVAPLTGQQQADELLVTLVRSQLETRRVAPAAAAAANHIEDDEEERKEGKETEVQGVPQLDRFLVDKAHGIKIEDEP